MVREALDAADLSPATAGAAERLVVALLPFHPDWSAGWLATLVRGRGHINFYSLGDRLSDADVRRIAPALLPVLGWWETREREMQLVSAADSLGRRLRAFDGLVDLLERLLRHTRSPWTADWALRLLAQHRRERFTALVPALLREDKSWMTRPPVYAELHRRRQDLLTPFLGQRAYRGRFSTGRTRFVLPLRDGFVRWTPAQQQTFARTLTRVIDDSERDSPAVLGAVDQLAALPAVPPDRLIKLAGSGRAAVRDAALHALGRLDAGQGVPALLKAMGDDRARVAIYALRRAVLDMPATRALPLLRGVGLEKVTVAKEVVRLLGELRSDEAYGDLLALDGRAQHRDVRVALLRAMWEYPERPETWAILERAAASPDAALAAIAGRMPADRLSPASRQQLVRLLSMLVTHPDPRVRLDALNRCISLPVADTEQVLLPHLLDTMGSSLPDERTAAAGAVFATCRAQDAPLVAAAIGRMLADRRALRTAIDQLQAAVPRHRGRLLPVARAVLDALAADPLTVTLRVELAAWALPWDELPPLLAHLAASGELHCDALGAVVLAVHRTVYFRPHRNDLTRLESTLAASPDERLRRVALAALVARSDGGRGWDDEHLARLRSYRADPAPLVAAAAQFTLPPLED